MYKRSLLRAVVFLIVVIGNAAASPPAVRDGDIIFQTSQSSQSIAIQRATGSPYSHMGIIFLRQGKPFVLEATATVRYTPLSAWIARGKGGHYVIKRLKDVSRLQNGGVSKLRDAAARLEGRPYDLTFEWSDDRIYCSELVWKIYDRALHIDIGELQHLRDFNLTDPVVKMKMRQRYGDHVPLDEAVISPGVMFRSPLLETAAQN